MATQTPKRRDDLHGEEQPEVVFGYKNNPDGHSNGVYDRNEGQVFTARKGSDSVSSDELNDKENSAGSNTTAGSNSALDASEHAFANRVRAAEEKAHDKAGLFRNEGSGGRFSVANVRAALSGRVTRKNTAMVAIVALLGGGGIYGLSILSGPFQFIHFAQRLQTHFHSNEDFGNDRTSKVLLYALADKGAQNGRLGVVGNAMANKWEKRLLDETGFRPLYEVGSRRFAGFEMVNQAKAEQFLGNIQSQNNKQSKKLAKVMGNGASLETADNNSGLLSPDGTPIQSGARFVDLRPVDFGDRRTYIRTIGQATQTDNVASALGSRSLIKRAGVPFHVLNKAKQKVDEKVAERIKERRADVIDNGVEVGGLDAGKTQDEDGDGQPDSAAAGDVEASEDTKRYIQEFRDSGAFRTAKGAAIITGVLCITKHFGNNAQEYKFQNNVLPMMRMGFGAIAVGNQGMAGDDIDIGTMGVLTEFMYDKEKETSWNQAESILAEDGKSGGIPIQPEADLGNISQKSKLFRVIDDIRILGTVCSVQDTIGNLPIIKQAADAVGAIGTQLADAALSLGGTSTDELMEAALKVAAGKSVDPNAKGADFGNLANTGAFLAANDQAIATGGTSLSANERSQLALLEESYAEFDDSDKSLASRLFDPASHRSVVGSLIDSSPGSPQQLTAKLSNPVSTIASGISGTFSSLMPKARAAGNYDYGVPKYGFSVQDQSDERFEDPYANAQIVEPRLNELNEKYSKCFGMAVSAGPDGVTIDNADKSVNVFELENKEEFKDCRDDKNTEIFKRYRFYIADAVTVVSLSCYEGDDTACSQIGVSTANGDSSGDSEDSGEDSVSGNAQELAQQILNNKQVDITVFCRYCREDLQNTADGKPAYGNVKIDVNLLKFLAELGRATPININSITGAGSGHSSGSNHYSGKAVDFECGLNEAKADEIGKKYGYVANNERCDNGVNHSHYSPDGL